jgi:charged multivesicular body protein 3
VSLTCAEAAKKGQKDVCKVLAKSLVQSKQAKNRIHTSKAQMNSVMMEMQNQLSANLFTVYLRE